MVETTTLSLSHPSAWRRDEERSVQKRREAPVCCACYWAKMKWTLGCPGFETLGMLVGKNIQITSLDVRCHGSWDKLQITFLIKVALEVAFVFLSFLLAVFGRNAIISINWKKVPEMLKSLSGENRLLQIKESTFCSDEKIILFRWLTTIDFLLATSL